MGQYNKNSRRKLSTISYITTTSNGVKFIADFHIHSKYSRATSPDMNLESLDKWAKIKGIKVLGTGDFTHPEWFKNIKERLVPAEPGLFKIKNGDDSTRFILTAEISCIYSKKNRVRKIHIIIFAPSFEVVDKINAHLGWIGNLKSDGRPILGLDAKELAKIVLGVSPDCLIVPAHCLLPNTYLHVDGGIEQIKNIKKGDFVYTHKGRLKKVTQVLKRPYSGPTYTIKPFYFRSGLATTPEHPYLILRNDRYHGESDYYGEQLKREYFKSKKPIWVEASKVKVGDILLFPRFNKEIKDKVTLDLDQIINPVAIKYREDKIAPIGFKVNWLPNTINIDEDFCRLAGYYLSEGYTNSRDAIGFCFKEDEKEYIGDLQALIKKTFGLEPSRIYQKKDCHGIEIIYFSKILVNIFGHLFYISSDIKRAHTKAMPDWMLGLPLRKQVEIFKGWWRGDMGYTSSRTLMNQMKIILLRLGIIPSICEETKEDFNKNHVHLYKIENRIIKARHSLFKFNQLSFFQDLFDLLEMPEFQKFNYKTIRRNGWIDKNYIYLPIKEIKDDFYQGEVYNLEVDGDNSYLSEFATVHNCWTPWFSIFGSRSGFDSIEECFEEYSKYIYAVETGLSSDPPMNWRLSALDKITLISNSDAHSPQKIGREANVFDTELSYGAIVKAIKEKDPTRFLYTIEFFPEEGKYHYDGHRNCKISLSPQDSKKYNNVCPTCGKPLTIGVLNRVEGLADRKEGFGPAGAIPFKNLIPLQEIIAESLGITVVSKQVAIEYKNLIKKLGSEFNILLEATPEDIKEATLPEIAEGIARVREGRVSIQPGYDGVYGKISIFSKGEQKQLSKQNTLF